ncbi:MAG TPA: ferrochelatase [Methylomirabilota bacterium]|jgi:ferrochelatase|nr:ferrochelatase [Methylomirabilota bacterium]
MREKPDARVNEVTPYDALLLVSFGGPEGMADVMPFLDQVLRGRTVPPERKREVAHHYERFGGVSPINAQNRALLEALRAELAAHGPRLPLYWGNRNWHPFLADALRAMAGDGVRRALALVTSAYSSYSGCRQYLEDIARARAEVGQAAPAVDKLRAFHDHPGFVEANADRVRAALATLPPARRAAARIAFTAHSVPAAMASGSDYVVQLRETCALVAAAVPHEPWALVYQSRSGPPHQPWLEPDILAHLETLKAEGVADVVVAPVGFVSDHMEIVYDLDTEARARAAALGLGFVRAGTAGTHPAFVRMIRELVEERVAGGERRALGARGSRADVCGSDCCPSGAPRPPERPGDSTAR